MIKYNWFEQASPFFKILLTLSVMCACLIMGMLVSVLIAAPVSGLSFAELLEISGNTSNPAYVSVLKFLQTVQSIAFFIIPPFLLAPLFGYKSSNYLSLQKGSQVSVFILAAFIILALVPFVNYTELLNSKMSLPSYLRGMEDWMRSSEDSATKITKLFLNVNTIPALLFNIFMMAVLPALGEEFIFRGVFQRLFTDWTKNVHIGIIITAAFFSAFHMQFYGFIPRMVLGMVLGYFLLWSGSLWVPIIAHFVNNAMGILAYYFINKGMISKDIETVGTTSDAWMWAAISIVLTGALLILMKNKLQPNSGSQ